MVSQTRRPNATSLLRTLASQLAINHLRNSVPPGSHEEVFRTRLRRAPKRARPIDRIVVVLGAGASFDGCRMPLGPQAARLLVKALVGDGPNGIPKAFFRGEVERLATEYQLQERDFETTLLALSKFNPTGLLEQMRLLFHRRFHPSLTYELLAHLAKHRMIDVVINFNFDETLDQSLDDEIARSNYVYVASDGDLARQQIATAPLDSRRARLRMFERFLYLKPHGTAGHPSSMRFTKSSYTQIAPGVHRLMRSVFDGPTTMIVIGHSMNSVEFNRIIEDSRVRPTVICIDPVKPIIPGVTRAHFCRINESHSLDAHVRRLWHYLEDAFSRPPRDVARHELIAGLFKNSVDVTKPATHQRLWPYFLERTYVELALAIAKSKGFVNLPELSSGRAGSYFREYAAARGNRRRRSLLGLCKDLGLHPMHSANEAMRLGEAIKPDFENDDCQLIVPEDEFRARARDIAVRLGQLMRRAKTPRRQNAIAATLKQMYIGAEVEVQPSAAGNGHEIFRRPQVLHTFSSVEAESDRLFGMRDWDGVLCIAETAEWLAKSAYNRLRVQAPGRVCVIVADTTYRERLIQNEIVSRSCVRLLPWWLHNRHFTLFLRRGVPLRGIYFERRLRATVVVPLLVQGSDAERLFSWFVIYAIKAERWKANRREGVIGGRDIGRGRRRVAHWLRLGASKHLTGFPDLT